MNYLVVYSMMHKFYWECGNMSSPTRSNPTGSSPVGSNLIRSNPIGCKLYICVREDVPDFITPTLVAHAVLRHHLQWYEYGDVQYKNWLEDSFKKCVVRVNLKEFEKIRKLHETHQMHITESWENKTLNGEVTCVTVVAEDGKIPNVLKFAKLWNPLTSYE